MKAPPRPPKVGLDVDQFIGAATTAVADVVQPSQKPRKKVGRPAEGVVRATYDMPMSVHDALKILAVREKCTMRDLVLRALDQTFGIRPAKG